MKTAVIVIPTYNEIGTIGKMIDYLFDKIFKEICNYDMKVLIVDANSPDGSAELINKKMKQYKNLYLIIEEKKEGI
jgi:dolichol-phosphate mannosyltransferase